MNKHYESAVVEAEKEIASLEERLTHLREFVSSAHRINGTSESLTSLSTPILVTEEFARSRIPETVERKGVKIKKGSFLPGSVTEQIGQILTEAGTPLTSGAIIDRLRKVRPSLSMKNPWSSICDVVRRHPKKFRRVSPGVYELRRRS